MDEGQPEIKTGKSRFRSEWVVAAAAMTVSILSLVVYIYQAKIMQEQQQTSVWPYLEWTVTTSTSDGFYISVINKGVGPAIVKKTRLTLDSMETTSVQFTRDLIGEKIDSLWAFYSRVDERVLAPGEEIRLFHIKDGAHARLVLPVPEDLMRRATYEITFASIYGDCWTSYGLNVVEGGCN
jgi:hypothetical protein